MTNIETVKITVTLGVDREKYRLEYGEEELTDLDEIRNSLRQRIEYDMFDQSSVFDYIATVQVK